MRAFRYGGMNVTYFLPKSSYKMNQTDLPSVCFLFSRNISEEVFCFQFEKKALADTLSMYMRAIMSLDNNLRSKIVESEYHDEHFDYLKIQCRSQRNQDQHEPFGEALFHLMKTMSFEGYTGHIQFNDYGERTNYALDVYQVTMNRLPRHVGNFTSNGLLINDFNEFEGRLAHDFDKERLRIISTILVCFFVF